METNTTVLFSTARGVGRHLDMRTCADVHVPVCVPAWCRSPELSAPLTSSRQDMTLLIRVLCTWRCTRSSDGAHAPTAPMDRGAAATFRRRVQRLGGSSSFLPFASARSDGVVRAPVSAACVWALRTPLVMLTTRSAPRACAAATLGPPTSLTLQEFPPFGRKKHSLLFSAGYTDDGQATWSSGSTSFMERHLFYPRRQRATRTLAPSVVY